MEMSDNFLNIFFHFVHLGLISFNLLGWLWKKTRKMNLLCLFLTFFSWFGLGLIFGIGYCPITEWHWQVKLRLGEYDIPASYIKYLLDNTVGPVFDSHLVDILTFSFFLIALVFSIYLNRRDWRRKKNEKL